jgi:hypothetical protein
MNCWAAAARHAAALFFLAALALPHGAGSSILLIKIRDTGEGPKNAATLPLPARIARLPEAQQTACAQAAAFMCIDS